MKIVTFADPRLQILWSGCRILPQYRWNHSRLSQPFWRLYWNASPGATITSGSLKVELDSSVYVLIAPNTIVTTSNARDVEHLYIHFRASIGHIDPTPRVATLPADFLLNSLKDRVVAQLAQEAPSPLNLSLAIRPLVEVCLSSLEMENAPSPCNDSRILAVLTTIEENLGADFSNDWLSKKAGMSVSSFNRHFKKEMGHPLHEYLKIRRIERACRLLQSSDISIEEVAEEVGFCDRFYFSRVFKTLQGVTPAAYRQAHRDLYR